jgi:hypothetical protein
MRSIVTVAVLCAATCAVLVACGNDVVPLESEDGGKVAKEFPLVAGDRAAKARTALEMLPYEIEIRSTSKDEKKQIVFGTATAENGKEVYFAFRLRNEPADLEYLNPEGAPRPTEVGFTPGVGAWSLSSPVGASPTEFSETDALVYALREAICQSATGEGCPAPGPSARGLEAGTR